MSALIVVLLLMLVALVAAAFWRDRPLRKRFANPDVENICRDWEKILGPRESWDGERREMFRNIADHRTSVGSAALLALLSAFLALPANASDWKPTFADWRRSDGVGCHQRGVHVWCEDGFDLRSNFTQDPLPPPAPPETPLPGFADTQAGATAPAPEKSEPKLKVMIEAGPSSMSTPAAEGIALDHPTIELFATARINAVYEQSQRFRILGYGELDRVTDGSALTIADFSSVRAARGKLAALYRIKDTPLSIGAVGGLNWSLQTGSLRDPNIWDFGGIVCLERFRWWPNGGLACLGGGRWEGRDGVRFEVRQPIAGDTFATYVKFTVPFTKLPEFVRSLQGVATAVPLHGGPPTAEELRGVGQRLPVSVSVGGLVTIKTFSR